ncbi:MAG: 2OG-Fe(II) oxygenase [Cyanobacteriota bacterium]|nr:2OG-Fe(II) oxygenase [Cyanobacteriota bacterium]
MNQIYRYSDKLFVVRNLLDNKQCDKYIEMAELIGFEPATITTSQGFVMDKSIRNNDRVILDDEKLAKELFEVTEPYIKNPCKGLYCTGLNERFRFYKYSPGQKFGWHYDGYYERENGERSRWTLLFYLNDGYEGGATKFRTKEVTGNKGDALFFLHRQLHCGEMVKSGVKYVLRTDIMYESESN